MILSFRSSALPFAEPNPNQGSFKPNQAKSRQIKANQGRPPKKCYMPLSAFPSANSEPNEKTTPNLSESDQI
jgi:hypothetical protein